MSELTEEEREYLLCDCGATEDESYHGPMCSTVPELDGGFDGEGFVDRAARIIVAREAALAERIAKAIEDYPVLGEERYVLKEASRIARSFKDGGS